MTPNLLKKIMSRLKKNREAYLAHLPIEKIISILDQVARRWLNPRDPIRQTALKRLTLSTGCSKEVICEGLNLALREVRRPHLQSCLKDLSRFPQPKLSAYIFGGIIPTPMLFDIFLGLLLKSVIVAKNPSREPFFPILLAQSVREVDPKLGKCIASFWWPGGKSNLERTLFNEADLIHAYGDDETIQKIRPRIPRGRIFLPFGHKISLSFIGKEKLTPKNARLLAQHAAYDIALYDQQGCMSPHVIYVQKNRAVHPFEWTKTLAQAMGKIGRALPPGKISLGEASKIHQIRGQYQFRKGALCISSHPKTDWTVIYEEDPKFHPSCLNRVIFVKPLKKLEDLPQVLKKWKGRIQAIGYALESKRIEQLQNIAKRLRVPALLPMGSMQALSFKNHIKERLEMLSPTT